eukprot:1844822-Pleurochrysis_carterae.AAC.3
MRFGVCMLVIQATARAGTCDFVRKSERGVRSPARIQSEAPVLTRASRFTRAHAGPKFCRAAELAEFGGLFGLPDRGRAVPATVHDQATAVRLGDRGASALLRGGAEWKERQYDQSVSRLDLGEVRVGTSLEVGQLTDRRPETDARALLVADSERKLGRRAIDV